MSLLAMPAANDVRNGVFPDEYIEHYADRYIAAGIGVRGVTFAQYLADPARYDNFDRSLDPLPLTGKQQRIRKQLIDDELSGRVRRIARDTDTLPKRNGYAVEPLHHHRYPRSVADFIPRRER